MTERLMRKLTAVFMPMNKIMIRLNVSAFGKIIYCRCGGRSHFDRFATGVPMSVCFSSIPLSTKIGTVQAFPETRKSGMPCEGRPEGLRLQAATPHDKGQSSSVCSPVAQSCLYCVIGQNIHATGSVPKLAQPQLILYLFLNGFRF